MSYTFEIFRNNTSFVDVQMILLSFFDNSTGFRLTENQCECSVHILRRPWLRFTLHVSKPFKWLGASQTTSRESGCPTRPPQIWPGASLRDYISCLQVLVWPPGPNQLIQAVKRQFEANFVIFTGWMLAPITPKVVGQNPKYFRGLMYS